LTAQQGIMGGVHDERLSQAVVAYIWGDGRRPWPSAHPDVVDARFGDEAVELLPHVLAILDELHQEPDRWLTDDLAAMGERISQALGDRHPELTGAAIDALAAHFTYTWK
jgi:hypothetical protein